MDAQPAVHPTDETLAAYGLGKADTATSGAVTQHLETCPDCRQRVAELSNDSFAGRLRGAFGADRDRTGDPQKSLSGLSRAVGPSAPSPPPPAKDVPPELTASGQYADVRVLGAGGMGVVYLARNVLLDRDEVLKVVGHGLLARPGAADRFLREIRSAAKLQHPNVVAAYSAMQFGDLLVFAMEYVPGDDLAKVVRDRGPLPAHLACGYAYHAALGLQHAHDRGTVHRDIKPSNLILTRAGGKPAVKVLDFGLAKASSEKGGDAGLTADGQMMGTPDFMAPEQARDAARADIRADVYALGCTLYFLLTGRPPFPGGSLYEVLRAHQETPPPPLEAARPDMSGEVVAAVRRMMAKDPADRFQTPGEVAKVLQPFVKPGAADPAGGGRQPPDSGRAGGGSGPVAARPRPDEWNTVGPTPRARPGRTSPAADAPRPPEPAAPAPAWRPPSVFRDGPVPQHTRHVNPEDLAPPARPIKAKAKADDKDKPKRKPAPARKRPAWVVPAAVAGAVLLAVAAAGAGGLFKAKTKYGTVVVENVPGDAAVEVDGETVTVTRAGEAVTINALTDGPHKLKVTQGGKPVWSSDVTVTLGGDPVRVRMEPPAAANAPRPEPPAAEFLPLFNGRDLTGWKTHPKQPGGWKVEGGVLVGKGPTPGHLYTDSDNYEDVHVRVEALVNDGGNSGVFARATFGPTFPADDRRYPSGYEAQIYSGPTPIQTGSLYLGAAGAVVKVADPSVPANRWFVLDLIAEDDRLAVSVDGKETARYTDDRRRYKRGHLALQMHDAQTEVRFRKVEAKRLGRAGRAAADGPAGPGAAGAPAAGVFGPEGSEWAGIFTGQVGGKASQNAAAVTFIERNGTAFKMLWRTGAGAKRVIDGTIDANGRLKFEGVRAVLPDEKPRSTLTGTGEVQTNKMTLAWENPETGWIAQGVFKRLPGGGAGFHFPGRWHVHHEPNNWNGVRRVTADRLTTDRFPGDGPWERDGGLIITHYPGGGREWLVIDPDDPNTLKGSNGSQSITWTRQ